VKSKTVIQIIHPEEIDLSPPVDNPADDPSVSDRSPETLGDRVHSTLRKQFHRLTKHEQGVLDDRDPEDLHQMRVAARRLQAALQAFEPVIELPTMAQWKQVRSVARTLGKLRDLDVQTAAMQNYGETLDERERRIAQALIDKSSQRDRAKAFNQVKRSLASSQYAKLKSAYQDWIEQPQYTDLAQLPLELSIADLLNPLLSAFLLHPGWFTQDLTASETLHDLRKQCKAVRYQAEFFADFYPASFQEWIEELKVMQDQLGVIQDGSVLLDRLPKKEKLPELKAAIRQEQVRSLDEWKILRDKYLTHDFRRQLRSMVNR
jgi:CHAD domain-containing protein